MNVLLPGIAAATGSLAAWAVRGRSASLLGPVTWQGPPGVRQIALTFDDGPSESTPHLLDILDRHRACATFFVCGHNVRRLPAVAREIVARGHEIANHTDSHAALYLRSPSFIRREVLAAQETISAVTGIAPVWFRPPFGCRWPGLSGILEQQDLRLLMWSAIGADWRLPAERIVQRLMPAARPGAIFCLHDGRGLAVNPDIAATLASVRVIIPRLGESGFRFPTLSQFICPTKSPTK